MEQDWQERTILMLGIGNVEKLNHSNVLVAGLGGVGAYAAEMLCRAGIGKLTIADSDVISVTNLNRQLLATKSSINKRKTDLMRNRLLDINPEVDVVVYDRYLKDDAITALLQQPYDYVVDAIDTLSPKIYFLVHAIRLNHKVVSSMGAGGKLDPSRVRVADISETFQCKLAYDLRKRLRRLGITTGIKCVFSDEPVSLSVVKPTVNEKNKKSVVGTISYMPAVFGCYCAWVVIRDLLDSRPANGCK